MTRNINPQMGQYQQFMYSTYPSSPSLVLFYQQHDMMLAAMVDLHTCLMARQLRRPQAQEDIEDQ